MGFKCGIVGLPNVGKSTLFNALTKAGIEAANYPFCTIEPNIGIITVPDKRLLVLNEIVKPQRVLPTTMEIVDIAGLVEGASRGEGLGNKFLGTIREIDAILHVVRCFHNDDVVHIEGRIDPLSDIEVINTELALADMETVEKAYSKAGKNSKTGNKEALFEKKTLEKIKLHLDAGFPVRTLSMTMEEQNFIRRLFLLTAKPILYIANVDDNGYKNNPLLDRVVDHALQENAKVVPLCVATEAEITELNEEECKEYMAEIGLVEPGLNLIIRVGYELLGLQTYFTAGVKEVRAWTVPLDATAQFAAGVIHTDFAKGFIRAEVIAFDDFVAYRGEQGAKGAGKLRLEGKEYLVCDGDIMHFRFNV